MSLEWMKEMSIVLTYWLKVTLSFTTFSFFSFQLVEPAALKNGPASPRLESVSHFRGFVMITKIVKTNRMRKAAVSWKIIIIPIPPRQGYFSCFHFQNGFWNELLFSKCRIQCYSSWLWTTKCLLEIQLQKLKKSKF